MQRRAKTFFTLHSSVLTSCTSRATLHLISGTLQQPFTDSKLLHREALTHTQKPEAFAHRNFYTEKLLHRKAFTHSKLSHTEVFAHTNIYTDKFLHTANFYTDKFLHRGAFTQKSLHTYTDKFLHTAKFDTKK